MTLKGLDQTSLVRLNWIVWSYRIKFEKVKNATNPPIIT